jgi:septum formation protein
MVYRLSYFKNQNYNTRRKEKMKIILASKSPRRKELLEVMGVKDFEVIVSNADETFKEELTIEEQSKRLGYIKAKAVFDETKGDRIVIGSDTMVIKDNKIFGKPKDKDDAIIMLKELKNSKHTVITSITVLIQDGEEYSEYIDYDKADVYFKDITDKEIEKWIDEGNPYDKAGAYAIQSKFGVFVNKIDGNYFTIVGLPIHKLYDVIKKYI